ncbi:MAG TPA: KH domain-containing protein [Chloroflexota bacterium]|nr:KH domain-containing protein [Chloroflexota bacterium]
MKELVEYVARGVVEHPEKVTVTEIPHRPGVLYEIEVAPEDTGKIIGRQGRMINALRLLTKAAATRQGVRVNVEVV